MSAGGVGNPSLKGADQFASPEEIGFNVSLPRDESGEYGWYRLKSKDGGNGSEKEGYDVSAGDMEVVVPGGKELRLKATVKSWGS